MVPAASKMGINMSQNGKPPLLSVVASGVLLSGRAALSALSFAALSSTVCGAVDEPVPLEAVPVPLLVSLLGTVAAAVVAAVLFPVLELGT